MPTPTFSQWQASRRYANRFADEPSMECLGFEDDERGYVYATDDGMLGYIRDIGGEPWEAPTRYAVDIAQDTFFSNDLEELEQKLYDFLIRESGICPDCHLDIATECECPKGAAHP